jgi:hypothetical protein
MRKTIGVTQLVERRQSVKRSPGGSCEMAASLGVNQLRVEFTQAAVKIGPECMKLKNLHC